MKLRGVQKSAEMWQTELMPQALWALLPAHDEVVQYSLRHERNKKNVRKSVHYT